MGVIVSGVKSKAAQVAELAEEVMTDAELGRTSVETMVMKATRLARLVDDSETMQWLHFERFGYSSTDPVARKYIGITGRWIDYKEDKAYWGSISAQEAAVESCQHQLDVVKSFRPSGEYAGLQFQNQQQRAGEIARSLGGVRRVVAGVRMSIQAFATRIYHAGMFGGQAETIFEQYRAATDALLASSAEKAFQRMPDAFERLASGGEEAISHALTTCRRVIDSFADAVFPARDEPVLIGQQPVEVKANHTRNRLRAYVYERIGQNSRYERLNKSITALYDRVSTGVHADVDSGEARALVLQTYLILGELLSLQPKTAQTTAP